MLKHSRCCAGSWRIWLAGRRRGASRCAARLPRRFAQRPFARAGLSPSTSSGEPWRRPARSGSARASRAAGTGAWHRRYGSLRGWPGFVTAEIIEDDHVAGRERRHEALLDPRGEELSVDRGVEHIRASIRSQRSAAMKVMVRQWPCGVLPMSFLPRGAQPRIGVMLVLAQSLPRRRPGSRRQTPAAWGQARLDTSSTAPAACDCRPVLFSGDQRFF